jgi:hypothetical protein
VVEHLTHNPEIEVFKYQNWGTENDKKMYFKYLCLISLWL